MIVRHMFPVALALMLLGPASGCTVLSLLYGDPLAAPVEPPVPTAGTRASWMLELGPGGQSFVAWADGDRASKQSGSQGGYHFFVSLRITGMTPDLLQIEIEVDAGGAVVSRSASVLPVTHDAGAATVTTLPDLRAFVERSTSGPVLLVVKAIDPATGAFVSAQRQLVLQ